MNVLEVEDLSVSFATAAGQVSAVQNVSFAVAAGETLALVGESGSGKSMTSLGVMRLTPPPPLCWVAGQVRLRGQDGAVRELLGLDAAAMRAVRGAGVAMVFQDPMTSLNPVHTIGAQITEPIRAHSRLGSRAARTRAAELLDLVGIPDARRRLEAFPHQLSGGMRQRAMIAMALSCEPVLLIADEPTTALDVTVQAQILELLRHLQQTTGMAMIFITHNLGVVAEIADRVAVMYAGRIVEQADVRTLFRAPLMPYTRALLESVPRLDAAGDSGGDLPAIPGAMPDPLALPPGCAFAPRCAHARPLPCNAGMPALDKAAADHRVRCARWSELAT